jgi:mono/diheme cytochrome c family protein
VEAVYQRRCQRCHGPDGRGDGDRENFPELPDFTRHTWQQVHSDPQLVVAILEGKGHHMPAFAGRLSRQQAEDLVAYIRGLDPLQVRDRKEMDGDFEEKFRQLEKEWQDLRQQFRDLGGTPQSNRSR